LEGEVVLEETYILACSLAPFCCVGFPWFDFFFLHTDLFLFSRRSFGIRVLVILGIGLFFFNFDTLVRKHFLGRNEIRFDDTFLDCKHNQTKWLTGYSPCVASKPCSPSQSSASWHTVSFSYEHFTLVHTLTCGTVSMWWSTHWRQSSPSEVNFLIFAPSWTVLALGALIAVPLKFSHLLASKGARMGLLALEGLTMMYWFAGFVALAVFLSDRICFGTVCDVARASTAISAVNWLVWAVTFAFGVMQMVKGMKSGSVGQGVGKVEMHQGV
jgi:hypothetical protein